MEVRCILEARSALAESALWSPKEEVLYWLDQMRPEIHRLDPATGKDVKFDLDLPPQLGGLVLLKGGGMALAAADGITLLSPDMKRRTTLVNPIAGRPNISFNDASAIDRVDSGPARPIVWRARHSASSTASIPTPGRPSSPRASFARTGHPSARMELSCITPVPTSGW